MSLTRMTAPEALAIALDHLRSGRPAEAEGVCREVLAQVPELADAHRVLGMTLHAAGRREEAIAAFQRAAKIAPDAAVAHNDLGVALRGAGRLEEAIAAYQRALVLEPDNALALNNMGNALRDLGCLEEAAAALASAVRVDPGSATAHNNLGAALEGIGRIDEAIAAFGRAVELELGHAAAHNNLGNALSAAGRIDEAIAAYRRAIALEPGYLVAHDNMLMALHYHPGYDAQAILAAHQVWAAQFAARMAGVIIGPHDNDRTPGRRLRVGFVSADFRGHPVGRLMLPLFSQRDRGRFAFVAYSDDRVGDAMTHEFEASADEWRVIAGQSDAEVAALVRADRIDILVDLAQHTAGNRLLVFARKPAPVQVSMLGMLTTTGLTTIDYRLTDRHLDPPGPGPEAYTECSIRLPHCCWCYSPVPGAPAIGELPALSRRAVTFGCLNQPAKVSRPALELWITILASIQDARLILQVSSVRQQEAIVALCRARGVAPERVAFLPRIPLVPYLAYYHRIDVGLDPFPYAGGTTTLDALWMGVPVVTLAGRTAVGRGGASILRNLGMPELIAATPDEYAAIARGFAEDRPRLAVLRRELRGRMEASPLMDARQYTAAVADAFKAMWQRWCEQSV
jgi:predicted O-linked N-acetylglucosamine transferase (SPINDLY family)